VKKLTKEEIIEIVDNDGTLIFDNWYKNTLTYKNENYTVTIIPDYRDGCNREETLNSLMLCEDYRSVDVYKGIKKPLEELFSKKGDNY
jgi:hypothetical protein